MIRRLAWLLLALLAPTMPLSAAPIELRVMTFKRPGTAAIRSISPRSRRRSAPRDADIVGLQEVDGNLARIAAMAGYAHVDERRRILSRYPIFDSGTGRRETRDAVPYSITGLDPGAVHAWVMVRPARWWRSPTLICPAIHRAWKRPTGAQMPGK